MKFLCLADLHYFSKWDPYYNYILNNLIKNVNPDYILIAGDIIESYLVKTSENVYKTIREKLFSEFDIPVIFCLGNHEFSDNSIKNVLNNFNNEDIYGCYCLDSCGHFDILHTDYRLVGNVLWYDNSMKPQGSPMKDDEIDKDWLDSSILDFVPSVECAKCKQQIKDNIDVNKKHILLTHCVPHESLNWFTENQPFSVYNQYSGCANFLSELKDYNFEWAICGHTHKRVMKKINNINCINIGNDYVFHKSYFERFVFEV